MLKLRFIGGLAAVLACAQMTARAEDILERAPQPVVVEMFVSQACAACPPAAEYMIELADRDGVVALSWHVDYWNHVVGPDGAPWADPFSSPRFSARQRAYNKRIRGRRAVFTPQAIINGQRSLIGSKKKIVEDMIGQPGAEPLATQIQFLQHGDRLQASFSNLTGDQRIYLVNFRRKAATNVKGGGNAGLVFVNANIVESVSSIDPGDLSNAALEIDAPAEDRGCAVLVQNADHGAVAAAAYCPAP